MSIELGDGTVFKYKVVKTAVTDATKTDKSVALLPVVTGRGGLNLISCTGKYNSTTGDYDQRITVFATQI